MKGSKKGLYAVLTLIVIVLVIIVGSSYFRQTMSGVECSYSSIQKPDITSISPSSGPTDTLVTLSGTGFANNAEIDVIPPEAQPGPVNKSVISGGTSSTPPLYGNLPIGPVATASISPTSISFVWPPRYIPGFTYSIEVVNRGDSSPKGLPCAKVSQSVSFTVTQN